VLFGLRDRLRDLPPRARALLARHPALAACLAMAWIAALVPIWWPRFLPLLDQPNHLALIGIWHRLGDPAWGYQRFYTLHRPPVPYWGYYFPVHLLAYVFPIEVANKIYLSIYAAALPASVIAFGRRFGRSPWLALLTFPLVFSYSFGYGFITYCAGLPVVLFGLALLDAWLEQGGPARLAGALACAVAAYFLHFMPWMLLGVCAAPLLVAGAGRPRRALAAAAGLLATVAFGWYVFRDNAAHNPLFGRSKLEFDGRYERAIDCASQLYHRLLTAWPGRGDELTLLLLAVAWLAIAATGKRSADTPGEPRGLRAWYPELCFAICIAAYLLLPFHLKQPIEWWNVNARLPAVAALFGALLPRGAIAGRRRLLLVPALAASLLYPVLLARQFRAFNARAAGMGRLMDQVPRGSSTLVLMFPPNTDPALDPEVVPFTEFHSYAQLLGGGYNPFQVATGFPFQPVPGAQLPAPFWNRPQDFRPTMAAGWDYILTRNERADGSLVGAAARLLGHDGDFRLYAVGAPR
jgi:hypothetical protein